MREKVFGATWLALIGFVFLASTAQAQPISGKVTDRATGDPLAGVNILVKDKLAGTVTDRSGRFSLTTSSALPLTLVFKYIGYSAEEVEITSAGQQVDVSLEESALFGEQVVVSASRVDESILRAPVSIEKMDILDIRASASPDVYDAVANLKGVQMYTGSITFSVPNTRGFSNMQNWRLIQLIDGMDVNAPGLNYPIGGTTASSDLDLESIELVPGPGSALYGPNAFNGILVMNTKSPFHYQGLSLSAKSGMTSQDANGTNPYNDISLRYARALNNRLAFKLVYSQLKAEDWEANDESYFISASLAAALSDEAKQALLNKDRSDIDYDAVNVYGDERLISTTPVTVDLGGGNVREIRRTGYKERDLVDYNAKSIKLGAGLNYRATDNLEVSYDYRYYKANSILRHTTIYPLVNLNQQLHRVELKSSNFFLRGYYSAEDAGDAYTLLNTAAYIQSGGKPTLPEQQGAYMMWAAEYGAAYRGEVDGVTAGNHAAARAFADRNTPQPGSAEFERLRTKSLGNPDVRTGGSKFIENTSLYHLEGNYNFSNQFDVIDFQVGGSFRQYNLDSEGQLFNDGPLGFNAKIPVPEYGTYAQASKKLVEDRLKLTASARYDKSKNFEGRITPRASAVLSLGDQHQHNFRVSTQTGFRNPGNLESYITLDVTQAIILGGVEDNIENYSYALAAANPFTQQAAGTVVNGMDIYKNLYTIGSFGAFAASGFTNPALLAKSNIEYIKQEEISTYEVGYKGLIGERLMLDINYYHNTYDNFSTRVLAYSTLANRVYSVYTSLDGTVTSNGFGASVRYSLPSGYVAGANFEHATFDAEEATKNNPGFLPGFNTPENRYNLSLSNRDLFMGVGFNLQYRWADEYVYQSPFGEGLIEAHSVVDFALSKRLPSISTTVKLGGANILNQQYRQVYGGPDVGAKYYLGFMFDRI